MTEPTPEQPRPSSPALGELAAALAGFQSEAPTVGKNKTASIRSDKGSYSYSYADLADITKAAYPILAKYGLAFTTLPSPNRLTGFLIHTSGEYVCGYLPLAGNTPQQLGSSITYARRYLFGCLTGIVTDEDEDGQAASTPAPAAKKAASRSRQQRQPSPEARQQIDAANRDPWQDDRPPAPQQDQQQIERQQAEVRDLSEQRRRLADEQPMISKSQNISIQAHWTRLGVADRDQRLIYTAYLSGRDSLATTKDLTVPEAADVIKQLERLRNREALDQYISQDTLTGDSK